MSNKECALRFSLRNCSGNKYSFNQNITLMQKIGIQNGSNIQDYYFTNVIYLR